MELHFDVENPNSVYARKMVVWFEDEELFEEAIEAYRGASLVGMINDILPKTCFMASWVDDWAPISPEEGAERVELKVGKGLKLYQ